jgi:putative iron-dependent peroxidase
VGSNRWPAGPAPQPVLKPRMSAETFPVVAVDPGGEAAVRDLLDVLAGLQRSVGFGVPDAGLTCIAGVGPAAGACDHPGRS